MLCMHIPFLPRDEANDVLEEAFRAEESRSELLAEYGSSAFYGGFSSSDANLIASMRMSELEADFAASEEGELYFARLQAARLYEDVRNLALSEWDIPEFENGRPSYDHSPFASVNYCTDMLRGSDSDEDIPF